MHDISSSGVQIQTGNGDTSCDYHSIPCCYVQTTHLINWLIDWLWVWGVRTMKPQCCAKGQKHQPALQPPQDSLLGIGTCIMTWSMLRALCCLKKYRNIMYYEYLGNTTRYLWLQDSIGLCTLNFLPVNLCVQLLAHTLCAFITCVTMYVFVLHFSGCLSLGIVACCNPSSNVLLETLEWII
jgi:hypothetical protein